MNITIARAACEGAADELHAYMGNGQLSRAHIDRWKGLINEATRTTDVLIATGSFISAVQSAMQAVPPLGSRKVPAAKPPSPAFARDRLRYTMRQLRNPQLLPSEDLRLLERLLREIAGNLSSLKETPTAAVA